MSRAAAVAAPQLQEMEKMDTDALPEAIKHAAMFISELRNSKLGPQHYFELYLNVCDQLRHLENYFDNAQDSKGFSIVELYETVQHQDKIIPRLYLLITVASVYIKSKKAPAKDILFDLVELCRGVQHPMRGLFLRNYLSQMSKDKLPDINSAYPGDAKDSIEFILQNFGEMNKLWVRMQHQGAFKTMSKRELERKNMRQLVGTNLVRLSEMRGVDLETYQNSVLPRILEQVINCKDIIAQEYLMDAIIQVFPDDFHLATLETFLTTCAQLNDSVNVKDILIVLMNRLSMYAREHSDKIPEGIEMFPLFNKYSAQVIEAKKAANSGQADLGGHLLPLQVALCNFAARCYPDHLNYVDSVLDYAVRAITESGATVIDGDKAVDAATQLLSLPLESIALRVLELKHFSPLLNLLPPSNRKKVAVCISQTASKSTSNIETVEHADALFKYLSPLIVEEIKVTDDNRFEFEQEQHAVAQLFQMVHNEDVDIHFELYGVARRYFGRGGKDRLEFSLPPLLFNSLKLAERARNTFETDKKARAILGFVLETIAAFKSMYPELAMRMYLMAAATAARCGLEPIAYEFMAQAFVTYEDEISDSKIQVNCIVYLTAALQQIQGFSEENYDTLIGKCALHCSKLMIKSQAVRAVYTCSHLFWTGTDENPGYRDEKKVIACLKRSLKIANGCVGEQAPMFIEILNKYLYFFDRECPSITMTYIKNLIELIDEHMQSETSPELQRHYENTLAHVFHQKSQHTPLGERYRAIREEAAGADE